jgi:hypothetical protein
MATPDRRQSAFLVGAVIEANRTLIEVPAQILREGGSSSAGCWLGIPGNKPSSARWSNSKDRCVVSLLAREAEVRMLRYRRGPPNLRQKPTHQAATKRNLSAAR